MSSTNLIAKAETIINAPISKVWDALVNPAMIKQYMFGTTVTSNWTAGSPITWKGEWQGKPYEDKGTIVSVIPEKELQYSHFSPLTGKEDKLENYHTVTISLAEAGNGTTISLSQDKNATEKEQEHSANNWKMMLEGMKKVVEGEK